MGLSQLFTTLASREDALGLARDAVGARLAACGQVVGPIASVYRWRGAVEEAPEFLLILKAPSERVDDLAAFVRERHPYETPEITTVASSLVDERYLAWVWSEAGTDH